MIYPRPFLAYIVRVARCLCTGKPVYIGVRFSGENGTERGWRTFPKNTACHRAINSRKNWPRRGKKAGVAADELCSFLFAPGLLTISRPDSPFLSLSLSLSLSLYDLECSSRRSTVKIPRAWSLAEILHRIRDNRVARNNRGRHAHAGINRFAVSYNPA